MPFIFFSSSGKYQNQPKEENSDNSNLLKKKPHNSVVECVPSLKMEFYFSSFICLMDTEEGNYSIFKNSQNLFTARVKSLIFPC